MPQVVHGHSLKSSDMPHVFVNCDFVFSTRRKVRSVVRVPAYKPLGHDYLKNTRFYFKWLASCVFRQFLNAFIPWFRLKHAWKSRTQCHGYISAAISRMSNIFGQTIFMETRRDGKHFFKRMARKLNDDSTKVIYFERWKIRIDNDQNWIT